MNAPLVVSCPFPVVRFGWVCCYTHPQRLTGNGQLTRGASIINDCFRNPHFSKVNILFHGNSDGNVNDFGIPEEFSNRNLVVQNIEEFR